MCSALNRKKLKQNENKQLIRLDKGLATPSLLHWLFILLSRAAVKETNSVVDGKKNWVYLTYSSIAGICLKMVVVVFLHTNELAVNTLLVGFQIIMISSHS